MRIDKFLWFARLAASRATAQMLATAGSLRIDGRRVRKPSACVRPGSVITYATWRGAVRIVRVDCLPARRGPASEAQTCYSDLTLVRAIDASEAAT